MLVSGPAILRGPGGRAECYWLPPARSVTAPGPAQPSPAKSANSQSASYFSLTLPTQPTSKQWPTTLSNHKTAQIRQNVCATMPNILLKNLKFWSAFTITLGRKEIFIMWQYGFVGGWCGWVGLPYFKVNDAIVYIKTKFHPFQLSRTDFSFLLKQNGTNVLNGSAQLVYNFIKSL